MNTLLCELQKTQH